MPVQWALRWSGNTFEGWLLISFKYLSSNKRDLCCYYLIGPLSCWVPDMLNLPTSPTEHRVHWFGRKDVVNLLILEIKRPSYPWDWYLPWRQYHMTFRKNHNSAETQDQNLRNKYMQWQCGFCEGLHPRQDITEAYSRQHNSPGPQASEVQ